MGLFSLRIYAVIAVLIRTTLAAGGKSEGTCDASDNCSGLMNSAYVFVKPHANTPATRALVKDTLTDAGIRIISESEISGKAIDKKKLIDQHYYAIASKATILAPKDIPVPNDKFQSSFGEQWEKVLTENRAANAMEACKRFNSSPEELDEAWRKAEQNRKVVKLGGGFYCGLLSVRDGAPLYVFNAFFMAMRSKFVGKDTSIHYYEVEWPPAVMSWSTFRNKLLGPTDPETAPKGSIRRKILEQYQSLGLKAKPNKGDNGVHASASPFEGLAEKANWLNRRVDRDDFGKAIIAGGVSINTIKEWSVDPQVKLPGGKMGSIFDHLEDLDVDECLQKIIELNMLRDK